MRSVVGAVIVRDGRAFVHKRGPGRRLFPNAWDIPGGHVDEGEDALAALAREIAEETGWRLRRVLVDLGELSWVGDDGVARRENDYVVEVEGDLDAPRLEFPKHVESAWVGLDDLDRLMEARAADDTLMREIVRRGLEWALSRKAT